MILKIVQHVLKIMNWYMIKKVKNFNVYKKPKIKLKFLMKNVILVKFYFKINV